MGESKLKKNRRIPTTKREKIHVDRTQRVVEHKPFKLSESVILDTTGIPSSFSLLISTIKDTYKYRWRTFFFILSYGLIWYVLTYADTSSAASALYGAIFGVIATMATVWMVRHRDSGERVTVRFAYYNGMVQLIPFILIILFAAIQLTPVFAGFALFQVATTSGAVVTRLEQSVPILIWAFGGILSLYWLTSTLMAVYIVTIPGTLPVEALRAAKRLVDGRRWFIQRRIILGIGFIVAIYFGFAYLFAKQDWSGAIKQLGILFPIISIPIVNTYFYKLYKSLLDK
ncbi:hypothetical protein KBB17_00810 [Candidatus Saccharibacteria bacterium]|jgi:uncharacterized membrane protein (UPF0136 family)|nr:hypothetical protein [Candidatus Saccharibacteria bacterium]MBP9131882.1 hypothetical protein [Candidatus Saccharibacteria bacterium]